MADLIETMDEVLATLNDRERKVLRLRFGLEDGQSRTLVKVGKEFSVTRERIRQIKIKALRQLRLPSRSQKLHKLTIADRRHPGLRGYVGLQAAIFGAEADDFYKGYGLLCFIGKLVRRCIDCGAEVHTSGTRRCFHCRIVEVECVECGKLFTLTRTQFMNRSKYSKNLYCSRQCVWAVQGRTYGWGMRTPARNRRQALEHARIWGI